MTVYLNSFVCKYFRRFFKKVGEGHSIMAELILTPDDLAVMQTLSGVNSARKSNKIHRDRRAHQHHRIPQMKLLQAAHQRTLKPNRTQMHRIALVPEYGQRIGGVG